MTGQKYITNAFKNTKYWKSRRRLNMMVLVLQECLCGLDYSMAFLNMWLYIKSIEKDYFLRRLFYTLVPFSYFGACILFTTCMQTIYRKHVNLRQLFIFANTFTSIGNLVYCLNFSPWCLVVGRLLAGSNGAIVPIAFSEVMAYYDGDEISKKVSLVAGSFAVGSLLAPVLNFLFGHVDTRVNNWHLTYVNTPALAMAVLFLIADILVFVFLYDWPTYAYSDLYDVQSKKNDKGTGCRKGLEQLKETFFDRHIDIILIMFLSAFQMFVITKSELWFPLIVIEVLKWSIIEVNIIHLCACSLGLGLFIWLSSQRLSNRIYFALTLNAIVAMACMEYILVLLKFGQFSYEISLLFCIFYGCVIATTTVLQNVCLANFLTNMLTPANVTIANGIRLSFQRFGSLIGLLTGVTLFVVLEYVSPIVSTVCAVVVTVLVLRQKNFISPRT